MRVIRVHYAQILKRIILLLLSTTLIYSLCLRNKRYSESFETIVQAPEPKLVWEFIADFSNQQRLHPAITDFEIEYERGNYDNWEYGVTYHELSLRFPVFQYNCRAVFKVLPEKGSNKLSQPFRILTTLTYCAFGFCHQTNSEMSFTGIGSRRSGSGTTKIQETVHFDCSPILSGVCFWQLRGERKIIYDNIIRSADLMTI